ncbi:pilus assembly PilX family protein [Microbulbifer thermotolerans]|uniref:pilus assembly PilX family protein n=1 Tax=Microbulbifer thermotolerans TaxID=252514 RepID=UPI00224B9782|nr:PilX N-terminal domain-containing pilus assembly protein [Microbulbifer thermotolerans]MCX2780250.1 PilX N-terminal domain-containing pilus assembly protein [Microbulbifer thermotolerans]MCX2805796.1 PilX N-terminal domain-containing pilus assembly protein [Microbulbifer thermotolerans]MCX2842705.1 PilX N-terminal domain-containing pilus assembly protein [Microbulbifer thermotolerans]
MKSISRQSGAVLIVSLIILLVLTLIGVSGARGVLMNERMTFASRDAKIALEVAETMARKGEAYIDSLTDTSSFGTTGWLRTAGDGPDDLFAADTWKDANSRAEEVSMKGPDGVTKLKGRMFIEMAGQATNDADVSSVDKSAGVSKLSASDVQVFKIVARGQGIGGTERIVVTLYGKAF